MNVYISADKVNNMIFFPKECSKMTSIFKWNVKRNLSETPQAP